MDIVRSDIETMNRWRWIRLERRRTVRTVPNTGPWDEIPTADDEPLAIVVENSFIVF